MQLWLDTINLNLIHNATEHASIAGVTTNPSILSHADIIPEIMLEKLLKAQDGYVAVQVVKHHFHDMWEQAKQLAAFNERIIVKIPVTSDGLKTIHRLAQDNIRTLATSIFEPEQVLMAGFAGATYVAPYLNAIAEIKGDYKDTVRCMLAIIHKNFPDMKLMAASIKSTEQIIWCAEAGVHAITLPDESYNGLLALNSATDTALKKFTYAWEQGEFSLKSKLIQFDPSL